MSRTLTSEPIIESYDIKAKSLKKGDSIWVGKRVHKVVSNEKTGHGQRTIHLKWWGSHNQKDEVTLTVNSKLVFRVQTHRVIHSQK